MKCVVPGCDNTHVSVCFHSFPLSNAALCRTWLSSVRHPLFGADTNFEVVRQQQLKVCSDHFVATDYEGDQLKDNAVPIVFPWTGIPQGILSRTPEVTSNKEDSPVPTCSQVKEEDPVEQDAKILQTAEVSNILKGNVFVNPQCLLELFKCCSVCLVECCIGIEGSEKVFSVIQDCQSCGHHREWRSNTSFTDERVEDFNERSDHTEPFHEEHVKLPQVFKEEKNEDTALYVKVELRPESGDDDSKVTCNKEDSPVATCSQIKKEDPIQQDVKIIQTAEVSNILKDKVFVNSQCLLELFKCCSLCLVECNMSIEGSERLFSVIQDCHSCGHHREWRSHPNSADESAEELSEQKDPKQPFYKKHIKHEEEFQEEHRNEDAALYSKVEHTPPPEDEDSQEVVLVPHHTKNQVLSMEIKQTIVNLRNEKKSIREIGQRLGLSKSTVWNILKKKANTGDVINKKSSGRPRKTTEEDDQIILSIMMKNPRNPIQVIRNTLRDVGREVSANTIRKKLHSLNHTIATASLRNLKMAKQSSTAAAGQ